MPLIRIGHSPDPDDAFMFYALTAGKVKAEGIEVEHVLEDIESLNRRARTARARGDGRLRRHLHADPRAVPDDGSRRLDGQGLRPHPRGPRARSPGRTVEDKVVAIPGSHTTAALLLRIYVGDPPIIEVAFDKIPQGRARGPGRPRPAHPRGADHASAAWACVKVLDMGEEWERDTGLPLARSAST